MRLDYLRGQVGHYARAYRLRPRATAVLYTCWTYAAKSRQIYASRETIARETGLPPRTVDRAIDDLKACGAIVDVGSKAVSGGWVKIRELVPAPVPATHGENPTREVPATHGEKSEGFPPPTANRDSPPVAGFSPPVTEVPATHGEQRRRELEEREEEPVRRLIDLLVSEGYRESDWTEGNARERVDAGWTVEELEQRVRLLLAKGVAFSQVFSKGSVGPPDPNAALVRSADAARARAAEAAAQEPTMDELRDRQEAAAPYVENILTDLAGKLAADG